MKTAASPIAPLFRDRRVLLRLDLNVPLSDASVRDDFKLRAALPFIKRLRPHCSLIIATHLGEPDANRPADRRRYSTKPVAAWLKRRFGGSVRCAVGSWPELVRQSKQLQPGEIMVLENLRLFPGEISNDPALAARLARLADVYVNDAFAVCHRRHASVAAIADIMPVYPGPRLLEEVRQLDRIASPQRPLAVVLGGAKISGKLPLVAALLPKAAVVMLGGGAANTMLRARGYEIGRSLHDKHFVPPKKWLNSPKLLTPIDVVVQDDRRTLVKKITEIEASDVIVDIGPRTARAYGRALGRARTAFWNGPLGIFEQPNARAGTEAIAKRFAAVTARGGFACVGGGETVEAIRALGLTRRLSWLSTGGGASLSYVAGEAMPGLEKLSL